MNKQKLGLMGSAGLGAGLGAGLMYLLDPMGGGRRRALVRDQAVHALKQGGQAARKTSRDVGNRAKGLLAETGSKLHRGEVDDRVLSDRVRSKLGRVVSHPSAIEVTAAGGHILLSGPVLASEEHRLLSAVRSVRGVKHVDNQLEIHESAENVPALQGEGRTAPGILLRSWAPSTRLLGATAGGALAIAGLKRRDKLGAALSAVGLGLLAKGLTNLNGDSARDLLHHRRMGKADLGGGSLEHGSETSRTGLESALSPTDRELQTSLP